MKLEPRPAVIARLYHVFAPYPASRQTMSACSCCVSGAEIAALFSVPLGQLSKENLWRYSSKAMTTWGDETDWKHFLPRLLEIAMEFDGPGVLGIDWVGNKFSMVEWRDWPVEEVQALRDFWNETVFLLAARSDWSFANDWIEELARLGEPVEKGLAKWVAGATSDEVLIVDEWAKDWKNADSRLAQWTRRPEIETKLLERL